MTELTLEKIHTARDLMESHPEKIELFVCPCCGKMKKIELINKVWTMCNECGCPATFPQQAISNE